MRLEQLPTEVREATVWFSYVLQPLWSSVTGAYPASCSISKVTENTSTPPGRNASPSQETQSQSIKRVVSCRGTPYNDPARSRTGTFQSRV